MEEAEFDPVQQHGSRRRAFRVRSHIRPTGRRAPLDIPPHETWVRVEHLWERHFARVQRHLLRAIQHDTTLDEASIQRAHASFRARLRHPSWRALPSPRRYKYPHAFVSETQRVLRRRIPVYATVQECLDEATFSEAAWVCRLVHVLGLPARLVAPTLAVLALRLAHTTTTHNANQATEPHDSNIIMNTSPPGCAAALLVVLKVAAGLGTARARPMVQLLEESFGLGRDVLWRHVCDSPTVVHVPSHGAVLLPAADWRAWAGGRMNPKEEELEEEEEWANAGSSISDEERKDRVIPLWNQKLQQELRPLLIASSPLPSALAPKRCRRRDGEGTNPERTTRPQVTPPPPPLIPLAQVTLTTTTTTTTIGGPGHSPPLRTVNQIAKKDVPPLTLGDVVLTPSILSRSAFSLSTLHPFTDEPLASAAGDFVAVLGWVGRIVPGGWRAVWRDVVTLEGVLLNI